MVNNPSELPPGGAGALAPLLVLLAVVALLPVLLPALLPLLVLVLLPVIVLGLLFKGSAGPALGCLGAVIGRTRPSRDRPSQPGGLAFRLRTGTEAIREVEYRGRPLRLELGDEVEITGFSGGALLHVLELRNTTTGERRWSRLALLLPASAVVAATLLAAAVG